MPAHSTAFDAIGTRWSIETATPLSSSLQHDIHTLIDAFDATYSRFRSDSLVHTMATNGAGAYTFPESIKHLYSFYRQLYDATDGRVSPLVGGLLEDLGYDASYSLKERVVKRPRIDWDEAMRLDNTTLITTMPFVFDIGAAGKGLLVDEVSALLKLNGLEDFTIDASGDIYAFGQIEEVIGLEDPRNTERLIGTVRVRNGALCASASNRRQWGNGLHHIVDPLTQRPVDDVLATWVSADTTLVADGLATALFFVGPEHLRHIAAFSYARLFKDGSVEYSKHSKWEIYTT